MLSRVRILLTVAVVSALSVLGAGAASADTSDFEFESFHGDYTLSRADDGTSRLAVVETVVAVFPDFDQNRGIIRAVPNYYQRVFLDPQVQSVVDENGDAVPFELADAGDFLEIALGDDSFVYGRTTYVISFTVENAVGSFADTGLDEFYWDTNGTGAAQSFGSVSARLRVDAALTGSLAGEPACYRGAFESTDGCAVSVETDPATGETLYSASEQDFGPGENLSLAVGFAAGTFVQGEQTQPVPREPTTTAPWWSNLISGFIAVGSLALLVAAVVARVRRGSGAKGRGIIVPQYSVPEGLNVMAAADLVRRKPSAIPAQLVSLAVRRNIRIVDYAQPVGGADYALQYLGDEGVDTLEASLLTALFGADREPGETKDLAPDDGALAKRVYGVSSLTGAELVSAGLREKWRLGGWLFPVGAIVLAVLGILNTVLTALQLSIAPWPVLALLLALVSVLVGALCVQRRGLLTEAGAERRDYLLGMRVYLELAEQDRFGMLQSPDGAERIDVDDSRQVVKLYEKLLPFAVLWGVEEEWAKELEVKLAQEENLQLDWYTGHGVFSAVALTGALRGVSGAATHVPAATSSSWTSGPGGGSGFGSSFGGTGGGGFSGGGGGGGGFGGR
jgi:uncharacterized membrane protein YgcG